MFNNFAHPLNCNLITGINGKSILFELNACKFPRSFPLDTMHLLLEGVSIWKFKHWNGGFFSNSGLNRSDDNSYILSKKVWEEIGEIMEANRKAIPSEFG